MLLFSCSHIQLLATPWIAAYQAFLSFTISQSLLKLMFIQSVMPSNHLILSCPLLLLPSIFPRTRVFSNELALFTSGDQSIGASASVLPKNIQGWFPVGLTGLISLHSKGLSRVFSSTTVQKHQFFGAQPSSLWSNAHIHTWLLGKSIVLTILTLEPWIPKLLLLGRTLVSIIFKKMEEGFDWQMVQLYPDSTVPSRIHTLISLHQRPRP